MTGTAGVIQPVKKLAQAGKFIHFRDTGDPVCGKKEGIHMNIDIRERLPKRRTVLCVRRNHIGAANAEGNRFLSGTDSTCTVYGNYDLPAGMGMGAAAGDLRGRAIDQ